MSSPLRLLVLLPSWLVVCLAGSTAQAAGRPYAYTQGVEGLPQTGLELENWFSAQRPRDSAVGTGVDWWVGPVVGVTDQLEAALYAIFVQPPEAEHSGPAIGLGALRLQASYLLAPLGRWPIDVRIRVDVERPVGVGHEDRRNLNTWLTAIAGFDLGPLNVIANVGGLVEFETSGPSPWLIYAAAASVDVIAGVRVGVEEFGQYKFNDQEAQNAIGPTLGFGIGRVWAASTIAFGIGTATPKTQARIVFGLAF
jgi:hypothetical protein